MEYIYEGLKINSEELTKNDMPNLLFQDIYDLCGVDVAISLLMNMQGNTIQVPTKGLKNIVKKVILSEFDGTTTSIRQMARKFKVTEGCIRNILKDSRVETPSPGQCSLELFREN